ncbi:MAG: 30S ribosomal protein S15 [Dehalococcoidia bacterium]|jgi:small subunit ribosomal protein S15
MRYQSLYRSTALDKEKKQEIMKSYAINEKDTGSSDVQVAVLTERINQLSGHLKDHSHDQHTRRSLLRLIGRRRRLLAYLSREDINRYRTLIGKLGLRK